MQVWKRKGEVRCLLEDADGNLLQHPVIHNLVQSKAFPDSSSNLVVGATDDHLHQQLLYLKAAGFVEEVCEATDAGGRSRWMLTVAAVKQLRVYETICNPTPLFNLEPLLEDALPTATSWGLLVSLRAADWMLVRAPNRRAAREKLPPLHSWGLEALLHCEQGEGGSMENPTSTP